MMRRALLVTSTLAVLLPGRAPAQYLPGHPAPAVPPMPLARERNDVMLGMLAVNAALGAVTAGLGRLAAPEEGRSIGTVLRGAAWGSVGGSIGFAGKWIASGGASHGGLAGRQVSAVGYSMVQGAAFGESPLEKIVLPLGPLRINALAAGPDSGRSFGGRTLRVKVDLATAAGLGYELLQPGTRFDPGLSLRAGAPVFIGRSVPAGSRYRAGEQFLGIIRVTPSQPDEDVVLRHEIVHVIQYDQRQIQWGARADRALLVRMRNGDAIARRVDLGLFELAWGAATLGIPYDTRPWEREAQLLTDPVAGLDAVTGAGPRR
jgi:hypothetical protein